MLLSLENQWSWFFTTTIVHRMDFPGRLLREWGPTKKGGAKIFTTEYTENTESYLLFAL
jgi:hypothetical protein